MSFDAISTGQWLIRPRLWNGCFRNELVHGQDGAIDQKAQDDLPGSLRSQSHKG